MLQFNFSHNDKLNKINNSRNIKTLLIRVLVLLYLFVGGMRSFMSFEVIIGTLTDCIANCRKGTKTKTSCSICVILFLFYFIRLVASATSFSA